MSILLRQFIRVALDEAVMSGREIRKFTGVEGKDRWEIFLDRIRRSDPFILNISGRPNRPVLISGEQNPTLVAALKAKDVPAYHAAFKSGVLVTDPATDETFKVTASGKILKDEQFGSYNPLAAEQIQVDSLAKVLANSKTGFINLYIGEGKIVPVSGIEHIRGKQKEDIVLLMGKERVGFVSLKYADHPDEMMGWGGISNLYGAHEEVTHFIDDVSVNPSTSQYREIDDPNLALDAVYGEDRHVNLVAASKSLTLVPTKDDPSVFQFSGNVFYNPQMPKDFWRPVLLIFPSSTRGGKIIPGTRFGIYPHGFAMSKKARLNERRG